MKLDTNIRHVSGHCLKGFQGQRSRVKVTERPHALFRLRLIDRLFDVEDHLGFVSLRCTW